MRPVSDRFLRAVRGSHRMVAEARVVAPGQTGVEPEGTTIPILRGAVDIDGTAQIRSTVDMVTEGRGMWPTLATDLLAPYGNELFLRRGIQYATGVTEWVSLGYHRIHAPSQDRVPDGPISIAASDRMRGIVRARLTSPRQFPASTTYGVVLSTLVTEVYPWATIEWDDSAVRDSTIGRQVIAEEDRYAFCDELVKSVGRLWWWDHRGVLVVRTATPAESPVWEVDYGAGGVLIDMARELSDEEVYNGVVAVGEGADTATPVRALAVDNHPQSPTYWHGDFGKVPRFYSSPLFTSNGQAATAAAAMLVRSLGLPYSVDFTVVPNPALEPYDPVRVRYPGRSESHVIEKLSVPLVASGAMPATTREKSLVMVGVG